MSDPNQNSIDPQQLTQQIASSYVDDYMPPVSQPASAAQPVPAMQAAPAPVMPPEPAYVPPTPITPAEPEIPMEVIEDEVPAPAVAQTPNKTESELVVEEPAPLLVEEKAEPPMVKEEAPKMEVPKPSGMPPQTLVTQDTPKVDGPILPPEPEQPWPKEEKKEEVKEPEKKDDNASTPDSTPTPEPTPRSTETPTAEAAPKSATTEDDAEPDSDPQALESQNIFHMLKIDDAADKEKEMFLDELQQIIWEDFLDNDVELLLTEEELVNFKKIQDDQSMNEEDRQTRMVEFLEKLVPDLEKIMLEKALELKEAMFVERITQMKKAAEGKSEVLSIIEKADQLQKDQKWLDAIETLNKIA